MVKITTPETEEKIEEHQQIELENITKEELLKALENRQPKQNKEVALSLKITKNLSNQIRVYSKLHNTSMTNSIEQIITKFFENKTLIRDYFRSEENVHIAIPKEPEINKEYVRHGVNLIVNVEETGENKPNITPLDKQFNIIDGLPDGFYELQKLDNINNFLDEYDPVNECYYSNYHVGLNGEYTNKFLNHYGLVILEKNKQAIMEDGKLTLQNILGFELLGIHSYANQIVEVRLLSTKQCYDLATKVNNQMVLDYFNNFPEYEFMENLKNETIDRWVLLEELQNTKNQLINIEGENNFLKKDNEQLQHIINNLRKKTDIKPLLEEYNQPLLSNEEIKLLQNENKQLKEELEYIQNVQEERIQKLEKVSDTIPKSIDTFIEALSLLSKDKID